MYWPPLQPEMLVVTSLLSPENEHPWSINNFCSYLLDSQRAMQLLQPICIVLAAFMGKMLHMISPEPPENERQWSVKNLWS